jgi:hypothetical protein
MLAISSSESRPPGPPLLAGLFDINIGASLPNMVKLNDELPFAVLDSPCRWTLSGGTPKRKRPPISSAPSSSSSSGSGVPCQGPNVSGRGARSGDGGVESDSCTGHDTLVIVNPPREVGDKAKAARYTHDLDEFRLAVRTFKTALLTRPGMITLVTFDLLAWYAGRGRHDGLQW